MFKLTRTWGDQMFKRTVIWRDQMFKLISTWGHQMFKCTSTQETFFKANGSSWFYSPSTAFAPLTLTVRVAADFPSVGRLFLPPSSQNGQPLQPRPHTCLFSEQMRESLGQEPKRGHTQVCPPHGWRPVGSFRGLVVREPMALWLLLGPDRQS